jgi:hypothetical protein
MVQKLLKAGISVKDPTAKAMISQIAAVVMDGPTSYIIV